MKEAISTYFRNRRFGFFRQFFNQVTEGGTKSIRILDIGGTESYWKSMGFQLNAHSEIVLLNLYEANVQEPGFSSIKGNACNLEGIADKSYDLVFSNSVIEHLYTKENQQSMANEVQRVGKNYFIQTPNKYFPIEPHWVFPLFQFLPFTLKVFLTQHFNLGHMPKTNDHEKAVELVKEVRLISKSEYLQLFKGAHLFIEKFVGLNKSFIAYKAENK
jgi:2-polyprenyl-3-methyl-5-hydroxy-6-metoxy-1,4-benzoquinol methylase